jgi:RNA polymerase sigma-54 factor
MKQGLSLRVSQHLALTPQLQQSIRLLQLSTLELSQEVEQMLDENPFLDRVDDAAEREAFGLDQADAPVSLGDRLSEGGDGAAADGGASPESIKEANLSTPASDDGSFGLKNEGASDEAPSAAAEDPSAELPDWEGDGSVDMAPDDSEWGGEAPARHSGDGDDTTSAADLAHAHVSLSDHLHRQALGLRVSDETRAALYALIESLNEDGYLEESLEELAQALMPGDEAQVPDLLLQREELVHHLRVALGLLQHMEPTGVGARHLAECLSLQVQELRNSPAARAALALCDQPMELLARRDAKKLAQLCGVDEVLVREALGLIARLEPKPGRRFADVSRQVVVPDVIVTRAGRGFKVQLNPDVMPRLRVHDVYAGALREGRRSTGAAPMQQRLQEARWFIKNIQQRFDTILRVSSAIVERQRNFFMHGELAMRPLVLREIADELGLHESTISRVTTAKYMATPFGTYELKYFFGSSLGTETGGNASSTAVRALIKQLVAGEDPRKPLSDNALSDMLKEQGIECARRTVAKYREGMRIAPASLRKSI